MSAVTDRINAATRSLPDHLALVECRRVNVELAAELREAKQTINGLAAELQAVAEALLATSRGVMR